MNMKVKSGSPCYSRSNLRIELDPGAVGGARLHDGQRKAHTEQAVVRIREGKRQRVGLTTGSACGDRLGGVGVEVGESLGEALRMPLDDARRTRGQRQRARPQLRRPPAR